MKKVDTNVCIMNSTGYKLNCKKGGFLNFTYLQSIAKTHDEIDTCDNVSMITFKSP